MAKLVIVFVHRDDASRVVTALQEAELRVTELRSEGGFLRSRNATLLLGLDDEQVALAMSVIDRNSQRRTEQVPDRAAGWHGRQLAADRGDPRRRHGPGPAGRGHQAL